MSNRDRAREIVGTIRTIDDERLIDCITAALDEKDREHREALLKFDPILCDPNK